MEFEPELRKFAMAEYVKEPISKHPTNKRHRYVQDFLTDYRDKLKKGEKVLVNLRGKNVEGIIQRDISGNETSVLVSIGDRLVQKDLATIYGFDSLFVDDPPTPPTPPTPPAPSVTFDLDTRRIAIHGGLLEGDSPMKIYENDLMHGGMGPMAKLHKHLIEDVRYKHKHKKWRANVEAGMTPLKDMTTEERDERRRGIKKVKYARERIEAGEYYTGRRGGELRKGASRGPQLPLNPEEAELAEGVKRHRGAEIHGSTYKDFEHTAMLMGREFNY